MSEDRKVNLVFAAENQTKGTLQEIKQDVAGVATSVEQSGKKAAKGIEAIGDGGEKAASKLDGSTRSIVGSIQRATAAAEAGEKGTAKYFEVIGRHRGVGGDVLEPYLAQLRKAEAAQAAAAGSLGKMGQTAGQTRQALQQLPMQFQDIVVSLQAGQQPLTVMLQQGSQLAGSFGGAGAAAKALGSYVLGLVNPFTVAAAAVASLGLAMASAEKSLRADSAWQAYVDATGRGVQLSTEAMKRLRDEMGQLPGVTKSMATAVLGDLVGMRDLSTQSFGDIAKAAADVAVLMRSDVPTAAKELGKALSDPAKGIESLNEVLRLFSAQQVATAQEMVALGDKAGAQAYILDQLKAATQGLASEGLTPMQNATEAFGDAWDEMMRQMGNGGPLQTANDLMAGLVRQTTDAVTWLSRLQPPDWLKQSFKGGLNGMVYRAIVGEEAKPAFTGGATGSWGDPAAATGQTDWDRETQALAKATGGYKSAASAMGELRGQAGKLSEALKTLRDKGEGDSALARQLQGNLDGVNERMASMGKTAGGAAAKAKTAYQSLLSTINEKIAASDKEAQQGEKQTEAEKLRVKYQEELATKGRQFNAQQRADIENGLRILEVSEQQAIAAKELAKAWDADSKALDGVIKKRQAQLAAITAGVDKLQQEERAHALSAAAGISLAEAIERLAIARLQENLEMARGGAESAEAVAGLERELKARQELLGVLGQKNVREANAKAAKEVAKEWEKTAQTIGDTLADYIMGGGKDAAQYLKRLFATLVLQPVMQYGANSAMGALGLGQQGKDVQSVMGGNNVGTTVLNNSGMIGAGYQAAFGASVGASSASLFGANAVGAVGGDALGALIAGNGGWAGVSAAGGASAAAGGASAAGSLMSGVMAAAPYLAAIVALYAIISSMDDSGTPHSGAGAIYSKATGVQGGAEIYGQGTFGMGARDEYNAEMQAGISGIAQGLGQTLDAFAVSFGKTAGYSVATAFADDSSKDGAWGSLKIMDELGNKLVDWADSRSSKWAPREFADGEEGYKEYLSAVATDVKGAFLAMGLPEWADQILAAASDIDTLNTALAQIGMVKAVFDGLGQSMSMFADLGGEVQTALLNVAGGIDALSSVAGSYYQAVYSEQERLAHAREQMEATLAGFGATMPATREQYRALVEQQIAAGAAGAEFAVVLMGLAGIFGSVVDSIDAEFAGLADSVKGVFSPLIESIGDLRSEVAATVAQIKRGTEAMSAEEIRAAIAGVAGVVAPGTAGVDAAGAGVASAAARLAARQAANDAAQALAQGKLGGLQSATAGRDGVLAEQERLRGVVSTAKSEHDRFEDGGDLRGLSYNKRVTWMNHWAAEMLKAQQQLDALSPSLAAYNAEVAAQQAAYNAVQGAAQGPAEQLAAAQAALVAAQQAEVQAKADYAKEVNAFVASAGASVVKLGDLREEVVQYYEAQAQAVQSMIATAEQLRDVVGSIRMGQLDSAQTVAQLSGSYASDYSVALATTGTVRAGYAESMGATLPALADAMKTEAATSADWRVQTAKLLAQATNISGMLDADAEASDYEDVALGLLGSIDEALLKLDVGTKSAEQVIAQAIENGTSAQLAGLRAIVAALQGEAIPAFASGGIHAGGWRLVGERGPELEATGPSRIWNAQQTLALMSGGAGGGSDALVAEVRGLREDNRALQEAMVRQQADMNRLLLRWETQGMPEERVV